MHRNVSELDKRYMKTALSLALRGTGKVSPNPLVGCVIVGAEGVCSWGFHSAIGEPHAEEFPPLTPGFPVLDSNHYVTQV